MTERTAAPPPAAILVRAAAVLTGCAALALAGWLLARGPLVKAVAGLQSGAGAGSLPQPMPGLLPDLVAGLMAAVLLGAVCWLVATTALATLAVLAGSLRPGHSGAVLAARVASGADGPCPALVRRAVTAALGVAVAAGAAPALAEPSGIGRLSGLGLPDRATGTSWAVAAPATLNARRSTPPAGAVVVQVDDSLWRLAAGLLPDGAGDAAVTAAWHALYDANRAVVGADPDLIRPGTRLTVPDRLSPDRKEPQ